MQYDSSNVLYMLYFFVSLKLVRRHGQQGHDTAFSTTLKTPYHHLISSSLHTTFLYKIN